MPDNLAGWVATAGGGTLIGSIIMGLIQTFGKRGKDRADAADVNITTATKIMDRIMKENEQMREALILTLEAIEFMVRDLPDDSDAHVKAREARHLLIKSLG
ncbi:MAG TPA: hypothetical protein PK852_02495 [Mesotoga prima]|uniref:hypothetical protein n=1 Tax=Mesotoga prima TaxID=1184387 RepID=UPI002C98B0D6|nr:hypothetical protein [Mesotoga prima]HPE52964.1 hypothetical protein [Mesotoga prima]